VSLKHLNSTCSWTTRAAEQHVQLNNEFAAFTKPKRLPPRVLKQSRVLDRSLVLNSVYNLPINFSNNFFIFHIHLRLDIRHVNQVSIPSTSCASYLLIPFHPSWFGDRGGTVVKVLCYKSGGRWFDLSFVINSFRSHYGPGVDSASNRNVYQEHFLGVKAAGG